MSRRKTPPNIDGMTSLKVGNISYHIRTADLHDEFGKYGAIGDVYLPRDKITKHSRGFAFVRYYSRRDAEDALYSMDGKMLDGRELRVQMARYGRPTSPKSTRRYRYSRSYSRSRSRSRRRRSSRSSSYSRSRSVTRSSSSSFKSSRRTRSRSEKRSKSRDKRSHSRAYRQTERSSSRSRSGRSRSQT